ncbi:D-alanyl-D-alanine carboxypeptidase, partial [Streptomyces sp. GC420]|nr:D-alanyl-D-alanine carboxypeptidase [Streptomyces sp. GC420]
VPRRDEASGDGASGRGTGEKAAETSGGDQATTMFRVPRRDEASGDGASGRGTGEKAAETSGGDQATTMFRVPRRAEAGDEAAGASGGSASRAPQSDEDGEAPSADDSDEAPTGSAADRASAPGVDQATTMFRVPKRDEAADRGTAVFRAARAAEPKPGDQQDKDKVQDKAQGKAPEKTRDGAAADRRPPVDQATAVFRAVRPATPPATPSATPREEPAAERTSRFVPLQDPDRAAERAEPASVAHPERTTQQPLPPKPPLDLLAELTNTPPPPETPLRTTVRRIKIWTPLVLLVLIVFAVVQAVRPLPQPTLALAGEPTYSFEGGGLDLPWPGEGQSVVEVDGVGRMGSEGAQKPAPIASVAKVMTAYVILKEHPLKADEQGEEITADAQAEKESSAVDESTAPMKEGQKFTQRQMLQMLMIPSGNNAARLLARWDSGGDQEAFVEKMNDAAADLGMKDTTYTDPSGLDSKTVSTANDQLKLAAAVMQNEVFRDTVGRAEARIPGLENKIINNNSLLVTTPGVIGIKTGSSTPAGGNLMWAATTEVDGETRRILGVVLGQQADTGVVWDSLEMALDNSRKLIQAAQQEVTSATVVKKGQVVGYVEDGLGGRTAVVATKDLKAVGWSGLKVTLKLTDGGETVPHEAAAGTEIGTLSAGSGAGRVDVPVALQGDLAEPGFGDRLTRIS